MLLGRNTALAKRRWTMTNKQRYSAVPLEVLADNRFTIEEKYVFTWLCSHANKHHQAWPSVKTLQEETGKSRSFIQRTLRHLEEAGYITCRPRYRSNGGSSTNLYTIMWREPDKDETDPEVMAANNPLETLQQVTAPTEQIHPLPPNTTAHNNTSRTEEAPPPLVSPPTRGETYDIFNFWKERTGHERAVLDKKRKKAIERGLALFGAAGCRQAIIGICNSPFHQGQNDRGEIYDDLTLIFRDAAHAEKFREIGELYWRDEDDD